MIATSMTEKELARLAELARGKTVLEVGSWRGASTVAMAGTAHRVHAVDWHRGDPHAGRQRSARTFLSNLAAYRVEDRVVTHIGRAKDVLPMFRTSVFEFAFHDAYHAALDVYQDGAEMRRVLRPGSLLAFHDYGLFGVKEAVDQLGELVELTDTLAVIRV